MTEPRHPLRISEKRGYFKPFADDVGLLCRACGMDVRPVQLHLRISLASIYKLIHQGHPNYGKPVLFLLSHKKCEIINKNCEIGMK